MTKELKALEELESDINTTIFAKDLINYKQQLLIDVSVLKQALQRLEAIDNTNPSEALKCLEDIYRNAVFINEKQEIQNKHKIFIESPETNKTISEQCNTIKQALLKAQGQESKIEILKEYRKDYLDRLKNLEKYSQEQEKENAEYKQLEKELGCPLDVRCDVYTGVKVFDKKKREYNVTYTYKDGFITNKNGYQFYFYWSDYKKTWWLREDKSE